MRILTRRDTGLLTQWTFGTAGVDPDAQAFITAAGITDSTQQAAINILVTSLKSASLWTKFNAIYPFVGGTATSHKINLINPADTNAAFRLVFTGGWTHSSTGALPNGTNAFANTFLIPTTVLATNAHSSTVYLRNNSTNSGIDIGSQSSSGASFYLRARFTDGNLYGTSLNVTGNAIIVANPTANQMYTLSRTSATSFIAYKNAAVLGSNVVLNTGLLPNNVMYLGASNFEGSTQFYSNREIAYASIGADLSGAEVSSYYTIVQQFQTTLSRQV